MWHSFFIFFLSFFDTFIGVPSLAGSRDVQILLLINHFLSFKIISHIVIIIIFTIPYDSFF